MPATVVLGAQWGDEGKGRVVDYFSENADYVVRFQGGNNAGHTIVVGDEKLALSLIPSGILYPDCTPVIASGTVIDSAEAEPRSADWRRRRMIRVRNFLRRSKGICQVEQSSRGGRLGLKSGVFAERR